MSSESEDKTIRDAIKTVIAAAADGARIYAWNVLSHDLADWPGLFETEEGGRHGWVIKRAAGDAKWKGNYQRARLWHDYDLLGFYGFRSGKEGDNSDDEFGEICDDVFAALKAAPRLGLDATIEEHELLQWQRITTINCGEETLHYAEGRLRVLLCC
jgi:hypothetical protein